MFGHDDSQQQSNDTPTPDAALSDQSGTQADASTTVTPTATDTQDYLTDDTPSQASTSTDDGLAAEPATTLPDPTSAPATPAAHDDLLSIKQQALQQLTPLVGHLDQTPEEKFRTTMMMIQASDNDTLIKEAYAAAQAIVDEKTRAQALLDIVNEINYFTQNQQ